MQRYFSRVNTTAVAAATTGFFGTAAATLLTQKRTAVESFSGSHDDFTAKVRTGATIVDCYTDWCPPCKQIAPHFADMSDKYTGVKFLKVNVEENEEVGAALNVRSIPYFVLYEDGKQVGTVEGANVEKLTKLVEGAGKKQ